MFGYLTVVYRDVEHLMVTIFLPWFFLTPIFYTLDQLPGLQEQRVGSGRLHYVNFVTPFVEAIRDPLFFGDLSLARGRRLLHRGSVVGTRTWQRGRSRMDDQVAAQL